MINGSIFKDAILSGANNLVNQKSKIDELNVFPVPDGDTGINMSLTISAAVRELSRLEEPTVSEVADTAASAMLRGARGNSGVILSLLFRGISKGLKNKENMTGRDFAHALSRGVDAAYKAVMNPTEGTILTVARVAAEKAVEAAKQTDDFSTVFGIILEQSQITLEHTPELLPVLKKAGVVDAGGKGLVAVFEGMNSVIADGVMVEKEEGAAQSKPSLQNAAAEYEGEITFTYCTEYIVNREDFSKDPVGLRAYLESIGDSAVVVDDESIIKIHVHTDHPGKAIEAGIKYGQLVNIKIDNMRDQHESKAHESRQSKKQDNYAAVDPEIEFGFVAVAAGAGLHALFTDLGADKMVSGGQTMNPSTDDILSAILSVPAKNVFVLPNNKNIIMAAEQAVKLADRNVCVLQTRTVPQGLSAMLAFDPGSSFEDNRVAMTKALDRVNTGMITFAARNSDFDGHSIRSGEILALENGKLSFVEKDLTKAAVKLAKNITKRDTQYMTVIYGADVTDDAAQSVYELIRAKVGSNVDVTLVSGGQPVYYYIISTE